MYKTMLRMGLECAKCVIESPDKLLQSLNLPEEKADEINSTIIETFQDIYFDDDMVRFDNRDELVDFLNSNEDLFADGIPPAVNPVVYDSLKSVLNDLHPLKELNYETNMKVLSFENEIYEMMMNNDSSSSSSSLLLRSLILITMGNIFDFASLSVEESNDYFDRHLKEILETKTHFDNADAAEIFNEFEQLLNEKRSLMILGDNNGEIVFDKLFFQMICERYDNIEEMYYVVRGQPALNDVTYEDAMDIGLHTICPSKLQIIKATESRGFQGTFLEQSTQEFQRLFDEVDIILSKGMGNYETLAYCEEAKDKLFFLFIVKCLFHADLSGLPLGSFIMSKVLEKN